jgi:putative OPT family oligopeptide transporter
MVPLRRLLIVRSADELPYPEGTACAEVLRATTAKTGSGGKWIFIGLAVGAAVKLLLGAAMLIDSDLSRLLPVLPKAEIALEIAPALIAVGYILGYKQSSIMVSGSLISAIVLTPLIAVYASGPVAALTAGQIWSKHVRFIGAGAVAAAGLITLLKTVPTIFAALRAATCRSGRASSPRSASRSLASRS